jgi:hypothetical protein
VLLQPIAVKSPSDFVLLRYDRHRSSVLRLVRAVRHERKKPSVNRRYTGLRIAELDSISGARPWLFCCQAVEGNRS